MAALFLRPVRAAVLCSAEFVRTPGGKNVVANLVSSKSCLPVQVVAAFGACPPQGHGRAPSPSFSCRPIHSLPSSSPPLSPPCDDNCDDTLVDDKLLVRLRRLGTGPLCDADKARRLARDKDGSYNGLRLMCPVAMRARNHSNNNNNNAVMAGVARTVQLPRPNDFLAVLQALSACRRNDVLVVNSGGSTLAVAGGLFAAEASRRGLAGIVIDGPVRDLADLDTSTATTTTTRIYSTAVTPYSGTVQHPAEGVDVAPVLCGGTQVRPGDVVFGDSDGVLVGSAATFATLVQDAEDVTAVERRLVEGMEAGVGLHDMTNFEEHLRKRKMGLESTLQFK